MKAEVIKEDKYVLFKIMEEKLDALLSPEVKSQLVLIKSEGYRNIIMDLSEVTYTDSSGLSSVLTANRICKEQDGILVLCGLTTQVKKLLEITQLHRVIESFNTVQEAIDRVFMFEIEKDLGSEES